MKKETKIAAMVAYDVPRGFCTTDFDFVASLLTVSDKDLISSKPETHVPKIMIANIDPYEGSNTRLEFVLVACDGSDITKKIGDLQMAYTNRDFLLEPIAFESHRRQLRALINRYKKRR